MAFPPQATHVSGRRLIAHLLDGIVFSFLFAILVVPFAAVSDDAVIVYLALMLTAGHVAYFVLAQKTSGQTPGKRVAGIRVVDARGLTPDVGSLTRRSIPLLFEYIYVIAFISMQTSDFKQRLGDRWGDTFVIRADSRGTPDSTEKRSSPPGACVSCGTFVDPGTDVCPACGRLHPLGRG